MTRQLSPNYRGTVVYRHPNWIEPDAEVEWVQPNWRTVTTAAATTLLCGLLTLLLMGVHELAERGMGR